MKLSLFIPENVVGVFSSVNRCNKIVGIKSLFKLNVLSILGVGLLLGISFPSNAKTNKIIIYKMSNTEIIADGELMIMASRNSSASDFNFLMGTHCVQHKKLKARLAGCVDWEEFNGTHKMESLLNGAGNIEQHIMNTPDGPMEGMALRLFNPTTRLWTIHWASGRSGTLDAPVVGSFDGPVGFFYAKEHYQGKPILVQFKWDATNPAKPVWSQAFSGDKGESWEWNWHMYFSNAYTETDLQNPVISQPDSTVPIGVIELRNYVIKHGLRDSFMHYFEENFIQPQEELNGYLLGQYRVKGAENNFCWIRGFKDMKVRSHFLPAFYYGPAWKQHKQVANSMLANNDNVYLLKPLALRNDSLEVAKSLAASQLIPTNGIAVVDFYIANTKLDQLLRLFAKEYLPLLKANGVNDCTLWTCVLEENDFPRLPVFQDKNLLVTITFYRNELAYEEAMKKVNANMTEDLKANLQDAITIQNTMILYPTEKTTHKKL